MELNREQIKKALECCTTGTCTECPKFNKVPCKIPLMRDALALIKELTEEVASWKEIAEGYQKLFEDCAEDRAKLTEENERLMRDKTALECIVSTARNQAKSDTVRKMQERLNEKLYSVPTVYNAHFRKMIDQIAKEMMEEL